MKKRKALFSLVTLSIVAAFGLAACNTGPNKPAGNESTPQDASSQEAELEEIKITAADNKTTLIVGDTVQLTASVAGVTWKSRATSVATVSETGLVTAVGAGTVKIRAEKEGYEDGSISITVNKAPERPAHTTLRMEDCDHYSPTDIWGMDLSAYGMGFMGPGESPVEDNSGATEDGTSLGWLQKDCRETLTFTSNKAVEVEIGVTMAYNTEVDLSTVLAVKFNNIDISMTGRVCEGPEDGDTNNYYDFHTVSFGKVNLIEGNNVLEITMIGQGPNMDEFKVFSDDTALQIAVVKPAVKEKIVVANADIKIEVEETAQIQSETTGLSYVSANPEVATVSETGLVTGVAVGRTTITVSKEGMKDAKVEVSVREKAIPGQIKLEAEDGEIVGGRVENNNDQASGGAHVGYLAADTSLTLKFTATEAVEMNVSMAVCSNNVTDWSTYPNVTADEHDLAACMTLTFNGTAIDLTGKVIPAGPWGTWAIVQLGSVNTIVGENTFVFSFSAQGPNVDYVKLVKADGSVKPEKFTVSFDANGGTGEMEAEEVEEGGEYTLPENEFTAPANKEFAGWSVGNQSKQPGDKITVSADVTVKANWSTIVRTPKYTIGLENANHYDPDDFWGMDLSAYGMGIMGPGDSPVEDNDGATEDGTSLGWLQAGCKETLTFTSDKAVEVEIGVTMAYNAKMDLSTALKVTFNGAEISMAGVSSEGPRDGNTNNYYDFQTVSFGNVTLNAGNNVLIIEMLQQAPNMDSLQIFTDEELVIAAVLPVQIEATPASAEINAGETQQITSSVVGVTYTSSNTDVATVSETGLVTGVAAGKVTITVEKEGCKKATVEITVVVPGQIMIEAEDGTIVGGRVESNAQSSNGGHVGYLAADTSLTIKFTAKEAATMTLSIAACSNNVSDWSTYPNVTADAHDLAACMTVTLNNNAVDLTGKVIPAGPWGTMVVIELGNVSVDEGENTLVFSFSAQGPNIDYVKLAKVA